jgi:hypothetical protein
MVQEFKESDYHAALTADPLPDLPFELVSSTIGMGAYAL